MNSISLFVVLLGVEMGPFTSLPAFLEEQRGVDFDTEIVPLLTRTGCNAGSCHGAAAGRGGFRLSLLGGDPAADYDSIVRALEGRRVNLVRPLESLVLSKPSGGIPHKGGIRLEEGSVGAKRLEDWIRSGARRSSQARRLLEFEISPAYQVLNQVGATISLKATARFSDRPDRTEDVTPWTVFTASDPGALDVSEKALVKVQRRGQHVVIARFLDRVVPIQILVPLSDTPLTRIQEQTPQANFVDEEVSRLLKLLRLPSAPRADDATFLRRVRLDLTGRLPTLGEIEEFHQDPSSEKRNKYIDRLLASSDFVDYWTYRLALLFRLRAPAGEKEGALAFHHWLREQVRNQTPFDQLSRSLLTAVGDSHRYGPANFARLSADARGQAELVSEVFMGVRLQCANCHNHPLDRWTQDDYHGLAAVFTRLERTRTVRVVARGAVSNPRTGEAAIARIPGVRYLTVDDNQDSRETFAHWLTSSDNPYFARALVNRLWKGLFGRGLVEPVDDLRDTNPATHPVLLERLAIDFIENRYNLRHTLRLLTQSETYQRSSAMNAAKREDNDNRYYSHASRRPLSAEVLADALSDVTGMSDRYGDLPLGTRAITLVDPQTPAPSLDILGRCSRQYSCDSELGLGLTGGGLSNKLHRLNGELINRKLAAREGRLHQLIDKGRTNEEVVNQFYLRAVGRPPSAQERNFWVKEGLQWQGNSQRHEHLLEDIVWGLLNSSEFNTNH